MSTTTGGELLARALSNEGVKYVFGLSCPDIDPFLAALDDQGMRLIPIRHEAAGVHMAEGLYKTTGQVAVVLGNPGPGTANLIPGVVTARHEGVPVLVITSQHRSQIAYPSTPATFQGQDQLDLLRPAVKWGGPVFEWSRISELVRMAFREMWAGRPGPVQLEIPGPTLYAKGDPSTAPIFASTNGRAGPPLPSESQLEAAADLLAHANRPAVFAGSGVDRARANSALLELVATLDCPVIPSLAGRAVVPHDHPNYFPSQSAAADALRQGADVLLVVGSRVGNLDVPFDKYWGDPARCRVVQIDVDPRDIAVTRPVALGIVADAKAALEGLCRKLAGRPLASRGRTDLGPARESRQGFLQSVQQQVARWKGEGVHPGAACGVVGEIFGSDAVYVTDGGMSSLWAGLMLPSTRPSSYHGILELGMLGTGIPSAIGAKLGEPSREVVCVTGDGAAGFNVMELQTAAREGIKVNVIVLADGQWAMEIPNATARWGKTFGTAMGAVDWAKVAEGLGCHGQIVDTITDLAPALKRGRSLAGPSLVCVRTNIAASLAIPPAVGARFAEVYYGPGA
jgi:acetolactate synthase-1/2/3 large subunit